MRTSFKLGLLAAAMFAAVPAVAATSISNTANGNNIGSFGTPDTQTYGEVFTAPITGFLTSFTLSLNGGVGQLFGGVGTWNGPATFATGFGSPTNLYQSANVSSSGAQSYTFTPNIAVTAGQRYVAYLSVFGVAGASGTTTMPAANPASSINYFVFNNTSDPRGNPSWNYFGGFGDALFSATFDTQIAGVPEPASWALMILGFGLVGAASRRAVRTKVSFA